MCSRRMPVSFWTSPLRLVAGIPVRSRHVADGEGDARRAVVEHQAAGVQLVVDMLARADLHDRAIEHHIEAGVMLLVAAPARNCRAATGASAAPPATGASAHSAIVTSNTSPSAMSCFIRRRSSRFGSRAALVEAFHFAGGEVGVVRRKRHHAEIEQFGVRLGIPGEGKRLEEDALRAQTVAGGTEKIVAQTEAIVGRAVVARRRVLVRRVLAGRRGPARR